MIVDTSFILDFLKDIEEAKSKIKQLVKENEPISIAAPTIFELWTGVEALNKGDYEKNQIEQIIASQTIYGLDEESAEIAGKINGKLIRKGLTINPADCMIAGIAITNNQKVLTRDGHFKRIEGLKVESY